MACLNICAGIGLIEWELNSHISRRSAPNVINTSPSAILDSSASDTEKHEESRSTKEARNRALQKVNAARLSYENTLVPTFAFLTGMQQPRATRALALAGLGIAESAVLSPNGRPFGVLQRLSIASLLSGGTLGLDLFRDPKPISTTSQLNTPSSFSYYSCSAAGPLLLVAWNLATIYLAANPSDPFEAPDKTAQTRIDRAIAGKERLLARDYDPDGVLATVMTGVSVWIGSWCANNLHSYEQALAVGSALLSSGYMLNWAFPQRMPLSETFWTMTYTLETSGFSLIKYTILRQVIDKITQYTAHGIIIKGSVSRQLVAIGAGSLAMRGLAANLLATLGYLGTRSVEIFLMSGVLDRCGFTDYLRNSLSKHLSPRKAHITAALTKAGMLVGFALVLQHSPI